MNVLIFDTPPGIGRLVSSILRACGHRVALTAEPEEARLRISTSLFDAAVLGPAGAPRDLADFIEKDFPHLPLILAGVPVGIPAAGQLAAVLVAPLSAERLASAFRRLDHDRRQRLSRLPVALADEGVSFSCRLADLDEGRLVLAGESDEFNRYFGGAPRRVRISILGVPVDGEAARADRSECQRVRRVDVRVEATAGRDIIARFQKVAVDQPC